MFGSIFEEACRGTRGEVLCCRRVRRMPRPRRAGSPLACLSPFPPVPAESRRPETMSRTRH
eukprot:8675783-Pyramimonas_sp.AAC.1